MPLLYIQSIFAGQINETIPLKIRLENETVETLSLLNSGAGGKFIDKNYAKTLKLPLLNLERPIPAINVDGTLNKKGTIKQYVNLDLEIFGQTNHSVVGNWVREIKNASRIPLAPEIQSSY